MFRRHYRQGLKSRVFALNPAAFGAAYAKRAVPPIEALEQRRLLSVAGATLFGPTTAGYQTNYELLSNGAFQDTTKVVVVGPTTFQGPNVLEIDTTVAPIGQLTSDVVQNYYIPSNGAVLNDGNVESITQGGISEVDTSTYSPAYTLFPATLDAGTDYTASFSATSVVTGGFPSTSTQDFNFIIELTSDSTQSVTVPAGTFNAYVVDTELQTLTSGTVSGQSFGQYYYAAGVGLVKSDAGLGSGSTTTTKLTGTGSSTTVGSPASLVFTQGPSSMTVGASAATPFTVAVQDSDGNTVTYDTSDVSVYLTTPGTGSLLGTLTEPAVNGVATFTGLSVDTPGDYTITASSGPLTTGSSTTFAVLSAAAATFTNLSSGGALTVTGTSGNDTINLASDGTNLTVTMNGVSATPIPLTSIVSIDVEGNAGNDAITLGADVPGSSVQGGPGDDTIFGGPGNDTLGGGLGNDLIYGDAGDDLIHGGAGDDSIGGGQGNDILYGGLGNDTMTGGLGNDTLIGGAGNNLLRGGAGDDTLFAINGTADTLYGGLGNNTAHIEQGLDQIPNNDIQTILFT